MLRLKYARIPPALCLLYIASACATLPEKATELCNHQYQGRSYFCQTTSLFSTPGAEPSSVDLKFGVYPKHQGPVSHSVLDSKIVCTKTLTEEDLSKAGVAGLPSPEEMEWMFQSEKLAGQPLVCAIKKCVGKECKVVGNADLLKPISKLFVF
jgi:hypothetical protein